MGGVPRHPVHRRRMVDAVTTHTWGTFSDGATVHLWRAHPHDPYAYPACGFLGHQRIAHDSDIRWVTDPDATRCGRCARTRAARGRTTSITREAP